MSVPAPMKPMPPVLVLVELSLLMDFLDEMTGPEVV